MTKKQADKGQDIALKKKLDELLNYRLAKYRLKKEEERSIRVRATGVCKEWGSPSPSRQKDEPTLGFVAAVVWQFEAWSEEITESFENSTALMFGDSLEEIDYKLKVVDDLSIHLKTLDFPDLWSYIAIDMYPTDAIEQLKKEFHEHLGLFKSSALVNLIEESSILAVEMANFYQKRPHANRVGSSGRSLRESRSSTSLSSLTSSLSADSLSDSEDGSERRLSLKLS